MPISHSDYLAMLARTQKSIPREHGEAVERESELHQQITEECQRRGWLAFHGSMAHKTARNLGEPDFVILCEYPRVLLVEAKARNEKPSPKQQEIHAWAAKLGHNVHVVRNMKEFLAAANERPL